VFLAAAGSTTASPASAAIRAIVASASIAVISLLFGWYSNIYVLMLGV
jgi:hypothetical protein